MLVRLKPHHFVYLPLAAICSVWIALILSSPDLVADFYPLHFAARRIMSGLSPYGPQATAELVQQLLELLAVLGRFDCIDARADNGHAGIGQPPREI